MTPFLKAAIAEMLPNAGGGGSCAECGFSWSIAGEEALHHVEAGADRFADLLRGRDATRSPSNGVWSPSAYVWHVSDVTRAWSERLHSLHADPEASWAGFDPDALADARRYLDLPQTTGPWSLARSTEALVQAVGHLELTVGFVHPEWDEGTVADALRWVAHEVVHHDLDVRRGLEVPVTA
jgi:hypothetical protein